MSEVLESRIFPIYAKLLGEDLATAPVNPEARSYDLSMARRVSKALKAREPLRAAEFLQTAAQENPGNAWIQHRLGIVLRLARQWDRARIHYRNALLLDSDFPTGVGHYCYILHLLGDSNKAVSILNLRLVLRPTDKGAAKIQRLIARELGIGRTAGRTDEEAPIVVDED